MHCIDDVGEEYCVCMWKNVCVKMDGIDFVTIAYFTVYYTLNTGAT